MAKILGIVFHCFWHWLGSLLLVGALAHSAGSWVQITRRGGA